MDRIQELIQLLQHHNQLYFVDDNPEISDVEYDKLKRELKELHPAYFDATGATPVDVQLPDGGLKKVPIDPPMLSLDNVFDDIEFKGWVKRLPADADLVYEHKLDGLAIRLTYLDGILTTINTRGDGLVGEDVTSQYGLFTGIPSEVPIKGMFKVDGEAFLSLANFDLLQDLSDKPYKTARNAVAGLVRTNDVKENLKGLVSFNPYGAHGDEVKGLDYRSLMNKLLELGFDYPESANEQHILNNERSTINPTDGIVVKVNDLEMRKALGNTGRFPLWAIAYKYPAAEAQVKLLDIDWQTGRTGVITPVMRYEPTLIAGVTCERATLHNFKQFTKQPLRRGSIIKVCRSGDVIPKFLGVVEEGRNAIIRPPTECPSCHEPLAYEGSDSEMVFISCLNHAECPAQRSLRFINFCDRKGLNIVGLGDVTIAKLYEAKLLDTFKDIFDLAEFKARIPHDILTPYQLEKTLTAIEAAKNTNLPHLLKALGIPNVGVGMATEIAKVVKDEADLLALLVDVDRLESIDGMGWSTAMEIVSHFKSHDERYLRELQKLLPVLNVSYTPPVETIGEICVTGKFAIPRKLLIEELNRYGYGYCSSIKKTTHGLLFGRDGKQNKLTKAQADGILVMDVSECRTAEELQRILLLNLDG